MIDKTEKAVFLDRDGVLNQDIGYLYKQEDFCWIEDAPKGLKFLKERGYLLLVVTNQSGVARGYYEERHIQALHAWLNWELEHMAGVQIDAFYYCPHHPEGVVEAYKQACNCRKPKAGLIEQGSNEWSIDLSKSFLIGDKPSDLAAAQAAGVQGYQFTGGSLLAFVKQVLKERGEYV